MEEQYWFLSKISLTQFLKKKKQSMYTCMQITRMLSNMSTFLTTNLFFILGLATKIIASCHKWKDRHCMNPLIVINYRFHQCGKHEWSNNNNNSYHIQLIWSIHFCYTRLYTCIAHMFMQMNDLLYPSVHNMYYYQ